MGHLSIHSSKRKQRRWRLLDLVSAAIFAAVFVFFLLLLTPLGDSLAASGRQTLLGSSEGAQQRRRLAALIEAGHEPAPIEVCPADFSDFLPCEDPRTIKGSHCPVHEDSPLCLIPLPEGYRLPVQWPESLHKIWHDNVPYNKIANRKVFRGLMKKEGSYITFSDGGAMFPDGAKQYIEKLKQYIPMAGGVLRTVLDMGSGVGSFGGFLLAEDMLTLSFAPKDSSKQHIQFALERGVPAFAATLGNYRLPFSAFSFDLVHCYQCSIPFTAHNATYFVEVDRLLRPGAYLVISGPPVQWAKQDKEWADLQAAARSLCYELIAVDGNTAIWKKPNGDSCLPNQNEFGLELCDDSDEPSVAWYVKLKKCVSKTSSVKGNYAIGKIPIWPKRLTKASSRATALKYGLDVFEADNRRWARRVAYYKNTLNLKLGTPAIRNVMDMNAFLGGFAAALSSDPVWVMNVIPARKTWTLDVIYDRGLIGVYHNWCEPFSTYPRSYDLIHVSAIQSLTKDPSFGKSRCNLVDLMVEIDRMLRPQGTVVIRDSPHVIESVERIARVVRWTASVHEDEPGSHGAEKILVATKKLWTPSSISS
ncbi:probable methyltransferase PMT13 [Ipomoea triloba]|uniref:probable methyltransferase PMT13 n=1 Tax=Ipomoea triloba TaxID=35885 RepID=UPI00125D8CC5|nr:probable methyltransferase PMT13 [Ipomoea triloba]